MQLMGWYGKRVSTREATLPYRIVAEAMIDLLADDSDEDGIDQQEDEEVLDPGNYWTDVEENEDVQPVEEVNDEAVQVVEGIVRDPVEPVRLVFASSILANNTASPILQPDEECIATRQAMHTFMEMAIHEEDLTEEITTKDALKAPDREMFIAAIKAEIHSFITVTKTLVPISMEELEKIEYIRIGTTVKCKRKKRGNGQPDKHKARTAARGDELMREYVRRGIVPPETFSPTICALTFAL